MNARSQADGFPDGARQDARALSNLLDRQTAVAEDETAAIERAEVAGVE